MGSFNSTRLGAPEYSEEQMVICLLPHQTNCTHLPNDLSYIIYDGYLIPLGSHLITALLAFFCLITVAGNVLVVYSVYSRRYLRSATNYLIVSLAVADLIVGVLVMPFGIFYEASNHIWIFGDVACDLWHSIDILACTASIWNLCVISVDRYLALKSPLTYAGAMSAKRTFTLISVVWFLSFLLSFPAIAWWRVTSPDLHNDQWDCSFVDDIGYLIVSSLASFYLPTGVMMVAYWKIYNIASRHEESYKSGHKRTSGIVKISQRTKLKTKGSLQLRVHRGNTQKRPPMTSLYSIESTGSGMPPSRKISTLSTTSSRPRTVSQTTCQSLPQSQRNFEHQPVTRSSSSVELVNRTSPGSAGISNPGGPMPGQQQTLVKTNSELSCYRIQLLQARLNRSRENFKESAVGKKLTKFSQEKKAAKTLGVVIGCYILCWLPFFVVNVLLGICQDCVPNPAPLFTVVTWLGYCNSMLNPFIYSFFNSKFRRAFISILFCGYIRQRRNHRVVTAKKCKLGSPLGTFSNGGMNSNRNSLLYGHSSDSEDREYSTTPRKQS